MEPQFLFLADFQYSAEAQIFKGLLESENIEVFLRDNHTIDSDPLLSNAVGGVKIFVKNTDFKRAKQLLDQTKKYSVDDSGNPVRCPNCNQQHVELFTTIKETKSFLAFLGSLFLGGLPLFTNYNYKCSDCGFEFPKE